MARSKKGNFLSQKKYALDILFEASLQECKETNAKLLPDQGEDLDNPNRYRKLVRKLNYLTVTKPDIAFAITVVSQFLSASKTSQWNAVV